MTDPIAPANPAPTAAPKPSRPWALIVVASVAVLALLASVSLWQRIGRMQEQLARQSADSGQQALEAKAWARQAQDTVKDNAARLSLLEGRIGEVALQRAQLEELIQSLSRSRDDNLLVDIDAALRMAQQQAQLTGSQEPLLAALRTALQRVQRAAQPRLAPLQRALEKDLERLRSLQSLDLPALLIRVDEAVASVDSLPLANQAPVRSPEAPAKPNPAASAPAAPAPVWLLTLRQLGEQLQSLVRVSRIDNPEAMLLSPEQSFFVRENIKLKLLNARLGLLSRQFDPARGDMASAALAVRRYADPASRRTQQMLQMLDAAQQQVKGVEVPRLDASLNALSTLMGGR
ncbi:MAG: putative uroporphyrinogen-III C-methyltransferase [Pseudomonadota bacterium]|jgi:uroporphyrin-3 C-methyltransferase